MDCPTSTIDLTNICSQAMGIALDVTRQLLINYFQKWYIFILFFLRKKDYLQSKIFFKLI